MPSQKTPALLAKRRQRALLILLDEYLAAQVALIGPRAALSIERDFAAHIQVKATYLSSIKRERVIGEKLARQIESACGKTPGWMDLPQKSQTATSTLEEQNLLEDLKSIYRADPELARSGMLTLKKKFASTKESK